MSTKVELTPSINGILSPVLLVIQSLVWCFIQFFVLIILYFKTKLLRTLVQGFVWGFEWLAISSWFDTRVQGIITTRVKTGSNQYSWPSSNVSSKKSIPSTVVYYYWAWYAFFSQQTLCAWPSLTSYILISFNVYMFDLSIIMPFMK